MSLKIGLYRNKHKLCCSDFEQIFEDLPPHSHSENSLKSQLIDNLLRPQISQSLLKRERDFKRIYSATFATCREKTTRSNPYRNQFILGQHIDIGQKVFFTKTIVKTFHSHNIQQ